MKQPGRSFLALQEALDGRYVLERELGRGGMGIVFLARETALDRLVALKALPAARSTGPLRERFFHEARIAAKLSHPNIVPIYAVDEAGPYVYYTMAYIEGESLAQRVSTQGPLSAGEAARILRDVAWAVDYAHQQGVIHRDLKPQNILMEEASGRALVADFGIARALDETPPAGGGRTIGTYHYVSPEQAAGLPADERSDIYSLGVMGFVIATGKELFSGSVTDILEQHLSRPAPPLRVLGMHLDTTLSRAVGRCLAKDPEERFQTAGELAAALSLAPELRSDLPLPLRAFLRRLELASSSAPLGVLLGFGGLFALGKAVQDGAWGAAALAAGFLSLVLAAPILAALPVTRRLLKAGYTQADMVHALSMDLDRQKEELAFPRDRAPDGTATLARRVAVSGLGLFGLGAVAAVFAPNLPTAAVMGSMSFGAIAAVIAGGVLIWRERQRNELTGYRWLRFWESQLGHWTVKLAGLRLRRLPGEPAPGELPPSPAAELPRPAPGDLEDLPGVVHLSQSCVRRIKAWLVASSSSRSLQGRTPTQKEQDFERRLQDKLELLEAMLGKLSVVDAVTADGGSLAADLQAARAVCEAVEGLIGGREWSL